MENIYWTGLHTVRQKITIYSIHVEARELSCFSYILTFVTLRTIACQALLSRKLQTKIRVWVTMPLQGIFLTRAQPMSPAALAQQVGSVSLNHREALIWHKQSQFNWKLNTGINPKPNFII